jgi:AcrR family transcriptional regulator
MASEASVVGVPSGKPGKLGARPRNPRGQGSVLREQLIAAATELIEESGDAAGVTLRGVAKRVGIAAPSIYRHFPDVEHLLLAVVDHRFIEFARSRDQARAVASDPRDALLAGCRAYCEFALRNPGAYRFMFSERAPADGRSSPAGAAAFEALRAGIASCQSAGLTRGAEEPGGLAAEVWAALHGLVLLHLNVANFPWPASLDVMVDHTVGAIVGFNPLEREPTRLTHGRRAAAKRAGSAPV